MAAESPVKVGDAVMVTTKVNDQNIVQGAVVTATLAGGANAICKMEDGTTKLVPLSEITKG